MSKHRNYPYTTLWTGPLMDGWTGYFMDWIKDRQTKYFMEWPYGGKHGKDTLWTGLTEGKTNWILYGLVLRMDGQTGYLYFMDWPMYRWAGY